MRRREFLGLVGGAATAWPAAARAQQLNKMRRIGVLMNDSAVNDPPSQAQLTALREALRQLGWIEGGNTQIDIRWRENDDPDRKRNAAELIALAPDVILAAGSPSVAAFQRITHSLPIVFVRVADPVGAGFVANLARPGGNITGFMLYEYNMSGKWLELLKQLAPGMTRAAVLEDPTNPAGNRLFAAIHTVAQSLGVEVSPTSVRDATEIERAITEFARSPNGGLIVSPTASALGHQDLIIALAARYKLPAVYNDRSDPIRGGLISYGPDRVNQFRGAASYIDHILKGEKPADLPVQAPTKYELVINLKTAKALDLTVPLPLQASADEVVE